MTPHRAARAIVRLSLAALIAAALPLAAGPSPTGVPVDTAAGRIVAIGDVHGDYDSLLAILRASGLIDEAARWAGGDSIFVQTGDFLDRGPRVRAIMDLLRRLQGEAVAAGGEVRVLLGNHEAMNLVGDLRDVSAEAFAEFADDGSSLRRAEAYEAWKELQVRHARLAGMRRPRFSDETRALWEESHPPGFVEYVEALSPEGDYGRWLRTLPPLARFGDTLFLHGGFSPDLASVEEVNRQLAAEIRDFDGFRRTFIDEGLILPTSTLTEMFAAVLDELERVQVKPEKRARLGEKKRRHLERLEAFLSFRGGYLVDPEGPLWFRGFARWDEQEGLELLEEIRRNTGLRRFVAGHTPQTGGEVRCRFGGRVFLIDTGMLANFYDGRPAALEIRDGVYTAIYPQGREVLLRERSVAASPGAIQPRVERSRCGPPAGVADSAPRGSAPRSERVSVRAPRRFAHPPQARGGKSGPAGLAAFARWVGTALPAAGPVAEARSRAAEARWLTRSGEPLPFATEEELLDFLRTADVVGKRELSSGITRPWRLDLEKDGLRLRAVFRYVELQRDLLRTDRGSVYRNFRDSYVFEKAAYELARLLGLDTVPPVVLREVEGKSGSLQLWIENGMTEEGRREQSLMPPSGRRWQRQRQTMRLFDALIFNFDRNQGNILFDAGWKLWFIDHTRAFRNLAEIEELDKIVVCERRLFERLKSVSDEEIRGTLEPYLRWIEIEPLLKRRRKLVEHLEGLIEKWGEGAVLYTEGG